MNQTVAAGDSSSAERGANIKLPIYLDYQATTPLDPRALEAMMPYFTEHFGNPHSTTHAYGSISAEAVGRARGQVAP
ncbi:MAG: aminotransferase class V-fold PLP-dependent enzyme, partial [Proteobacteria bacterium]|nr:aminotransferase class V-fold PLP-dependent enzyme [Pseudomonadota bacterium]